MSTNIPPVSVDPGLYVLVTLLRMNGIGADSEQIRHRFGGAQIGIPEMLRCAKELGLKARERNAGWETTPMPAIAALRDGGFLLLGKFGEGKVLIQSIQVLASESLWPSQSDFISVAEWPSARPPLLAQQARQLGYVGGNTL